MAFYVEPLSSDMISKWNEFVDQSNEGTIFHRLDFLEYHEDRFRSCENHLIIYKGDSIFGVMPLAIFDEEEGRVARSPYGASYGGPVFKKVLTFSENRKVLSALIDWFVDSGVDHCVMVLPIAPCYAEYCDTFRLALLEYGFHCSNRDISSGVNLQGADLLSQTMTSRARNMVEKARRIGVEVVHQGILNEFFIVMEKAYAELKINPTHSQMEFTWLCRRMPDKIYTDVAYYKGRPVAGISFFVINRRVNSSFYLCKDPEYKKTQAQSLLIYEALIRSQRDSFKWFDFGTSSINQRGSENLFRFKESFGAVGRFRETYCWSKNNRPFKSEI